MQDTTIVAKHNVSDAELILERFVQYMQSKSYKITKVHPKTIPGQYSILPDIEFDMNTVVSDFIVESSSNNG